MLLNGQPVAFDGRKFLKDFGYAEAPEAVTEEVIAKGQVAYGLEPTGVIDEKTERAWALTPRCGMSDAPMATVEQIWALPTLKWYCENYPSASLKPKIDACVQRAWDNWAEIIQADFVQTNSKADANLIMGFARGSRAQFDGPGGTLAWHYLTPRGNFKGQLQGMADLDENWDWDGSKGSGIDFIAVWCHEGGHGLGLDHDTQGSGALMAPFYRRGLSKPQQNDIRRILALGYKKRSTPVPGPGPGPTPTPGDYPPQIQVKLTWPGSPVGPLYEGTVSLKQG